MITLVDRQGWQRSCKLCWFDVSSALVLIMREPKNYNSFFNLIFIVAAHNTAVYCFIHQIKTVSIK